MKVLVIVDAPNLYFNARKHFNGRKINYRNLLNNCIGTDNVLYKAIAYCSKDAKDSNTFHSLLKTLGFEVKLRPSTVFKVNKGKENEQLIKKSNFAVHMTIDIMKYMKDVECVLIVSSNSDLIPTIFEVKNSKIRCIIVGTNIHHGMKKAADSFVEIDEGWLEKGHETAKAAN